MRFSLKYIALVILFLLGINGFVWKLTNTENIAVGVFLYQFVCLFQAIGKKMPIRSLFGVLMTLNLFLGPIIAYNGIQEDLIEVYRMQVSSQDYFDYVLPAVLCFLVGLNIVLGAENDESFDLEAIKSKFEESSRIGYVFIGVGFVASFLQTIAPGELAFYLYLLAGFKFIGLYFLILGGKQLNLGPLILVYSSIIVSSLSTAMFHDLLIWIIFLGAVLAIKIKPSFILKLTAIAGLIVLGTIIQITKGDYRSKSEVGGVESFVNIAQQLEDNGGLFSAENLTQNAVRVNQGFIISHILNNVPKHVPFSGGESMVQIFASAIFPRFLFPNKLDAGDQQIFMKYTGMFINGTTAMALSSIGDAYANFGKVGGWVFMFLFGLIFNFMLKILKHQSKKIVLLQLFLPLFFLYPIRPDCELQTVLGHLFKSIILVTVILQFLNYNSTASTTDVKVLK